MPSNHPPARKFMKAIWELESSGSIDSLAALFTDDASIDTIATHAPATGRTAVEQFWKEYLAYFSEVATSFTRAIDTPDTTVLEWHSQGKLTDGTPIFYRGVTLLGWAGDRVKTFRAYYDSAAFVPEYEKHLKRPPRPM